MKAAIALLALLPVAEATAADTGLPPALQELFDSERAFVRLAAEKGFRDSFYTYFADDGVAFNPHPFRVRTSLASQPPSPGPMGAVWAPVYGDIAAAGDLGWDTGPLVFEGKNGAADRHGMFFSIWKRQADGSFKVVLDIGSDTPSPVVPMNEPAHVSSQPAAGKRADGDSRTAVANLLEIERAFHATAAAESLGPRLRQPPGRRRARAPARRDARRRAGRAERVGECAGREISRRAARGRRFAVGRSWLCVWQLRKARRSARGRLLRARLEEGCQGRLAHRDGHGESRACGRHAAHCRTHERRGTLSGRAMGAKPRLRISSTWPPTRRMPSPGIASERARSSRKNMPRPCEASSAASRSAAGPQSTSTISPARTRSRATRTRRSTTWSARLAPASGNARNTNLIPTLLRFASCRASRR